MKRNPDDLKLIASLRRGAASGPGDVTIRRSQLARLVELIGQSDPVTGEAEAKTLDAITGLSESGGYYVSIRRAQLGQAIELFDSCNNNEPSHTDVETA
ncbi:hypothetical protein [Crateriforma conspicua]|uniref:Uncharacterized protein n=1 Tax=Crateriforma conspicua TaxID=2527996 RepID=A0A5C5XTF0_9PLAN|nr:hypothetical protein [Crateriforma conspicua]TWT65613.1 hypothetical protein Pan14r_51600 [Crateriforma conspicua]